MHLGLNIYKEVDIGIVYPDYAVLEITHIDSDFAYLSYYQPRSSVVHGAVQLDTPHCLMFRPACLAKNIKIYECFSLEYVTIDNFCSVESYQSLFLRVRSEKLKGQS